METVISSSFITHVPASRTLTLSPPYDLLKIPNIIRIYNLTIGADIYNYRNPHQYNAPRNQPGIDISITDDGDIVYSTDATMTNEDEILIIVNIDPNSLSTETDLFTDETVAASTTVKSTTPLKIGPLSKLLCYVSNSGASTNVTVNIYTSPTNSTTTRKKLLATFTLGAGNVTTYETGNGIDPKQLHNYIWGEIVNGDAANAAIIKVELYMFR